MLRPNSYTLTSKSKDFIMLRIGITGQSGFVGTHLFNTLGLSPDEFERVPFEDAFFQSKEALQAFVVSCDVIVHLAAVNRSESMEELYATNVGLVKQLIDAMETMDVKPHILFSSSTQEERDNLYGKSKHDGRLMFEMWANKHDASFTGMIVPNVFGPFGQPFYNAFVPTFAYQLIHRETPMIQVDAEVSLIYVGSLCHAIINFIRNPQGVVRIAIGADFKRKVSDVLSLFQGFKKDYVEQGIIPDLCDRNNLNLFNTFRSYLEPKAIKLIQHSDSRGTFIETIRLGSGGQVSFSTTVPSITRGNHYHTRKVERFTVIKGQARIQLRKIGTDEVLNFELNGDDPAYVDMPVWYTHNITNTGDDVLYTQFWINEWYDSTDGDTYFEEV